MKKKVAIISLIGMLLSSNVLAYTDLEGYWGKEDILYLTNKNIINGYPDNTFNPQGKLTREESCSILSRYIGEKSSANSLLTDINGRWSENSIKHLLNESIVVGYPDRTFKPTEEITRSEFVTMLYRYLRTENLLTLNSSTKEFNDISGNWAETYIRTLSGMNILDGYPDGSFKPFNKITRGEAAAIITKLEKLRKGELYTTKYLTVEEKKEKILNFIKDSYGNNINIEEMKDKTIEEIFQLLKDENSKYMNYQNYQNYVSNLKGNFIGIGVHLAANYNNKIQVLNVIPNSPADRAGIKQNDMIEALDGIKYDGNEVYKLTKKLDGEVGTELTVDILREDQDGNQTRETKTLKREKIKVETVFPRMLDNKIGYLKVATFEEGTYDDFKEYYNKLKQEGARALIIDLRYNKGGLVRSARNMADDLVGAGKLYSTVGRNGQINVVESKEKEIDIPYVLLTNEMTASASEIVTAAVKDHQSGRIIGTKTYGKGTVQTVVTLPDGTGFKLTVAEYLSPNGNKIDKVGIEPDIKVEMGNVENIGPDYLEHDSQLKKAIEVLK